MTGTSDPLGEWVARHAHQLRTVDPDETDDADLEPLLDIVGDARVVAIGESMHRLHEFIQVRHRIFRFLVRRAGFTALVMESGFPEGRAVDAWIRDGGRGVRATLDTGVTYHFGKCQEMLDQVTWMRERRVADGLPLRFYGMDVPDSASSARPAVDATLAVLDASDPDYAAAARSRFDELFSYLPADRSGLAQAADAIHAYLRLAEADRDRLTAEIGALVERTRARRLVDAARAGEAEAAFAVRCAEIARSADLFLSAMAAGASRTWPPANLRDVAMADTVEWILEREPRIVVAAANGHVQKTPYSAPPVVTEPMTTTGEHLAARLGDGLVVIGSAYGGGEAWLHRPSPDDAPGHSTPFTAALDQLDAASLDAALARAGIGSHIVDLRSISGPAADALDAVAGTQNGPYVQPAHVRTAFDAAVFVDRVTPWHTWLDARGLTPPRRQSSASSSA